MLQLRERIFIIGEKPIRSVARESPAPSFVCSAVYATFIKHARFDFFYRITPIDSAAPPALPPPGHRSSRSCPLRYKCTNMYRDSSMRDRRTHGTTVISA